MTPMCNAASDRLFLIRKKASIISVSELIREFNTRIQSLEWEIHGKGSFYQGEISFHIHTHIG